MGAAWAKGPAWLWFARLQQEAQTAGGLGDLGQEGAAAAVNLVL